MVDVDGTALYADGSLRSNLICRLFCAQHRNFTRLAVLSIAPFLSHVHGAAADGDAL